MFDQIPKKHNPVNFLHKTKHHSIEIELKVINMNYLL